MRTFPFFRFFLGCLLFGLVEHSVHGQDNSSGNPVVVPLKDNDAAKKEILTRHTKPETLFSSSPLHHSGYGTVVAKFTRFKDEFAVMSGAYGGWFINDRFMVGLGGYGLSSTISLSDALSPSQGRRDKWEMGYGGLVMEYTLHSQKLIHASFNTLIGGGGVAKTSERTDGSSHDFWDNSYDSSGFFVVEPGVNVEVNILRWFRVGLGTSYRYVHGAHTPGISNAEISGAAANVSLKFGGF